MNYKATILTCIFWTAILSGCSPAVNRAENPTRVETAVRQDGCGDGECRPPEDRKRCPQDCREPADDDLDISLETPLTETIRPDQDLGDAVVYLGLMVHLEGWEDDLNQEKFERHVELVRKYADLFERYGAKLTFESKELTEGILKWDDNVLAEMEARGHGIGVHADIGGQQAYDCANFADDLRRERLQLESLGVQVHHVSGNTSHCDWVRATIEAGYDFTTGTVAYSVMSLPMEARPPEYRNCPNPGKCHQTFPAELEDRLHPWRTSDGRDWLRHDPQGELVILATSYVLPCMAEEIEGSSLRDCQFNEEDLSMFDEELQEAISLADPNKINQFYLGWSLGSSLNEQLMVRWLESIAPYVERGEVRWATLPEIYQAYRDWEQE